MFNESDSVVVEEVDTTCPAIGYQKTEVCVPVTVTPFAKTGRTKTKCCGTPVVTPRTDRCEGIAGGSCKFTIRQSICVEVPVEFGATASVGEPSISCDDATVNPCKDC